MDGSYAGRGRLEELTAGLVEMLGAKQRRWADIYRSMVEVEDGGLWKDAGFHSFTKWMESLAREAHCQIQYLWRVRKAGRFYARYQEEQRVAGPEVPDMSDLPMGDEMLADLDRVTEGNPVRAAAYMSAALRGDLTKGEVKRIVAATSATRRAGSKRRGRDESSGVTAAEVLAALRPAVFLGEEVTARRMLRGERRVWWVAGEFPVPSGDADRARRIDAMVVTNADAGEGDDQYGVVLRAVEVKVAESDLRGDTKHLDYEAFADECYFAVPSNLEGLATELAPDGWGVVSYDTASMKARVAVPAERRPGAMRGVSMATALVKVLPQIQCTQV